MQISDANAAVDKDWDKLKKSAGVAGKESNE